MKELFKNCLRIEERDGWIAPLRFTDRQIETYTSDEGSLIRANCPASVIMAFKSAAKKVSFEYRITGKARNWAVVDVVCDGVLRESVTLLDDIGRVEISLPGDTKFETHIYLPHLVAFELRDITSDSPLIPVEKKTRRWLALGDSITQGMVAKRPSDAYPSLISEHFAIEALNAGVGGIKFNAAELDYIGFEPDVITLALGCNDWGLEREAVLKNTTEYLERLTSLYKCRNIYYILPIWRNDCEGVKAGMTFAEHRELLRSIVSRYPFVNIVDGYALVPHIDDFYGDPMERKIHPNDEGFLRYAFALTKYIDFA